MCVCVCGCGCVRVCVWMWVSGSCLSCLMYLTIIQFLFFPLHFLSSFLSSFLLFFLFLLLYISIIVHLSGYPLLPSLTICNSSLFLLLLLFDLPHHRRHHTPPPTLFRRGGSLSPLARASVVCKWRVGRKIFSHTPSNQILITLTSRRLTCPPKYSWWRRIVVNLQASVAHIIHLFHLTDLLTKLIILEIRVHLSWRLVREKEEGWGREGRLTYYNAHLLCLKMRVLLFYHLI